MDGQVIIRNIYTYMHIIRINEKEAMNLKERKEGNMGGFGGKKGNNNNKKM